MEPMPITRSKKPVDPHDPEGLEEAWKAVRPSISGGRGYARVLEGKTFGYLKVLERRGSDKHGTSVWMCVCGLCGLTKLVTRPALTSGRVKSCGCLRAGVSKHPRKEPPKDPRARGRKIWDRLLNDD